MGDNTEDVVRGQGRQWASHIRPGLIDSFSNLIDALVPSSFPYLPTWFSFLSNIDIYGTIS